MRLRKSISTILLTSLLPISLMLPAMANVDNSGGGGGTPAPVPAPSGTQTQVNANNPISNSQAQTSGNFTNVGGNSNAFNINDSSYGARSQFASCSYGESTLGAFATGGLSSTGGGGKDLGNNSSFSGQLGIFANIPLNGKSKSLCQRITSTSDSFGILRACMDIGGQAVKFNPAFRFSNEMFFGLAAHGIDSKVVVACNALLPQQVVYQQPPVIHYPAPQPPVYHPTPSLPVRN